MKNLLLIICFIFLLNPVYAEKAEQWVEVKAPNGKIAKIDMSRLSIVNNEVFTFFARSKTDEIDYIYKIKANIKEMSMETIYVGLYSKTYPNGPSKWLYESEKPIPKNSSPEAMLNYLDNATKNDIRRADFNEWLPYYNSVVNKVKNVWKPKANIMKLKTRKYLECDLTIDKQGNIISYEIPFTAYENTYDDDFVLSVKEALNKVGQLKNIPNSYKGETFILKLAFIYRYSSFDKNNKITVDEEGYQVIKVLKK